MMMRDYFDFNSHTAIVTGGASGLGRAMADGLCAQGSQVAIIDYNEEAARKTASEIRSKYNKNVNPYFCDVSDEKMVDATFSEIENDFGIPDILINSAGTNFPRKAEEMTSEEWSKIISVNLTGTFHTCSRFSRKILDKERGSIINIASMSGIIVNRGRHISAYCAAKGGVIMYSKAIASEWATRGIRVNAIAPGYFHTPFNEKWIQNDEVYTRALKNTPLNRLGKPDEIIPLALFLASDASSFITGSVYSIDGGYTIW